MEPYIHLKERSYYEDLYDRLHVSSCRLTESIYLKEYPDQSILHPLETRKPVPSNEVIAFNKKLEEGSDEFRKFHVSASVTQWILYMEMGESYLNRESTIQKWIVRDTEKDKKRKAIWGSAEPLENKRCKKCGERMEEYLRMIDVFDKKDMVLFCYSCPDCKFREWEFTNWVVHDIGYPISKEKEEKLLKDLRKPKKPPTKQEKEEKGKEENLYERDKLRFSMDRESWEEFREFKHNIGALSELIKNIDEREAEKELKEKMENISFLEAQSGIKKKIDSRKFHKLKFSYPEIGRDIVCDFRVYEALQDRYEKDAIKELKAIFERALKNTNWTLHKNIECRLGIFRGKIVWKEA